MAGEGLERPYSRQARLFIGCCVLYLLLLMGEYIRNSTLVPYNLSLIIRINSIRQSLSFAHALYELKLKFVRRHRQAHWACSAPSRLRSVRLSIESWTQPYAWLAWMRGLSSPLSCCCSASTSKTSSLKTSSKEFRSSFSGELCWCFILICPAT